VEAQASTVKTDAFKNVPGARQHPAKIADNEKALG
jgi:hypothetical protein